MRLAAYRSFLDQLAKLLTSGIPIREALDVLARQPARSLSDPAAQLSRRIAGGETLGDAMAALAGEFPPAHAALVRAADRAGAAPGMLERLRDEVDRMLAQRRLLVSRSIYPLSVLALCILLPPFHLVIEGKTGAYLAIQVVCFGSLAAVVLLVRAFRRPVLTWLERTPFVGGVIRGAVLGESLSLLGLLVGAGLGLREALDAAAGAARTDALKRDLLDARFDLERGSNLSEALARLPLSDVDRSRLGTGEHAGKIDTALVQVGRSLEESAQVVVFRAFALAPVVLYIGAGAIVLYLALRAFGMLDNSLSGL